MVWPEPPQNQPDPGSPVLGQYCLNLMGRLLLTDCSLPRDMPLNPRGSKGEVPDLYMDKSQIVMRAHGHGIPFNPIKMWGLIQQVRWPEIASRVSCRRSWLSGLPEIMSVETSDDSVCLQKPVPTDREEGAQVPSQVFPIFPFHSSTSARWVFLSPPPLGKPKD